VNAKKNVQKSATNGLFAQEEEKTQKRTSFGPDGT
jgi:hypothetical protein